MKIPFALAAFSFGILRSAFCIAAEPPPAAAQEGVRLWEGGLLLGPAYGDARPSGPGRRRIAPPFAEKALSEGGPFC